MKISQAIEFLDKHIANPSQGLPEEIFLFISRNVLLVNVDLLIQDEKKRTLLAWRDDKFVGKGWHLPGGIVRFKENLAKRILKVAETEIGTALKFDPVPLAMNEMIGSNNSRGHFISILYKCFLSSEFIPQNRGLLETDNGYLCWHDSVPDNLVKVHQLYKKYILGGR